MRSIGGVGRIRRGIRGPEQAGRGTLVVILLRPVPQAMGLADPIARGAIRFSLRRETTAEEIDAVVQCLTARL